MCQIVKLFRNSPVELFSVRSTSKHFSLNRGFSPVRLLLIAVVFLLSIPAAAQDTVTGAFQGTISNNLTGDAIAGASVEITNEQTGVSYSLTTDSRGQFYQGLLAPGIYQIRVSIIGFQPRLLRRPLNVAKTGEVVPVPVSLEPEIAGATQPTQAVLEEADNIRVEINTTDARRDGSFKNEEATTLPLGASTVTRTFDELALLLPGVAPPPQTVGDVAGPGVGAGVGSAGQFAVNGLRSRGNNFTVDGSDNNDEDIGVRRQGFVALISQPVESVQEFQIITLLAPAQFGRNIGAQVNIVSKAGGNKLNGSIYGFFNSSHLNARNYFDTTNGNERFALTSTTGQAVLLDGEPLLVKNGSGGENSFTSGQAGGTLGGAIIENKLFYFLSGEYQKINAMQEKNFIVPTVEERGFNRTGASGIFRNIFPTEITRSVGGQSLAVLSLLPFSNNPTGTFGENTFTQTLPASGRGIIMSGRIDNNFKFAERQQTVTARYNFTDDKRIIPAINEAIFSSVLSKTLTQNFSFFLNSQLNRPDSDRQISNQVRFSLGRTGLNFSEVRDTEFLIPSDNFSHIPFLLNAPLRQNITRPAAPGVPNTGPVQFRSGVPCNSGPMFCPPTFSTTEQLLGPVGQVVINGFSPIGTDVYNFPQTRVNNTYQLADELSWRLQNHTFVFGADVRRTDLNSDLPSLSRPLLIFNGGPRLIPNSTITGRLPTLADQNPIFSAIDMVSANAASSFRLSFNVDRPDSKVDLRYYQFNFYGQDTWRARKNLSVSYGLRYEYNSPVHEVNGLIEQTFSDPRTLQRSGLSTFIDGRKTLYEADKNNFAPRVGIAYSPELFGDSRPSVFRAGYGIFYDQILGAVVNQSRNVFPTFTAIDFALPASIFFLNPILQPFQTRAFVLAYINPVGNPAPIDPDPPVIIICHSIGCLPRPNVLPGTLNIITPGGSSSPLFPFEVTLPSRNLEMPAAHHYSFIYEQQLNKNFAASVGYVGTTGRSLLRFTTPNLGPSTTVAVGGIGIGQYLGPARTGFGATGSQSRPVSGIGTVYLFESTASSTYNSLQTQLRARLSNNLNFQFSYTFSKVTDDVSDVFDMAGAYVLPQNSLTFEGERAAANFDVRHRWTYQAIYDFPEFKANSFLRALTNNLQIAATGKYHSGQPFTVNSTIDVNLDGNLTDRLNTTNGIEITGDRKQPIRLTTDNFLSLLAPFGQDGKIKRNSFRAGSVLELDLSVIKQFSIYDRRLSFRTDIFNFINRANFGIPVRLLEAPGFGKATGTVTPGRRVQFALKYEF